MKLRTLMSILAGLTLLAAPLQAVSGENIRYEGSPAIGKFIEIAGQVYHKSSFMTNVKTKSKGGEECVFNGTCDIGGVANQLKPELTGKGVKATLIGKDAVAIIVNSDNPVASLSLAQLRDIFSGKIRNWKEVGGRDLAVDPLVTSPISATHDLVKKIVMGDVEFRARVMEPDPTIVLYVSRDKGAIGFTSAFIPNRKPEGVKEVRPNGEEVSAANPNYPLSRPLYLITKDPPGQNVRDFIEWTLSEEGQSYLKIYFQGAK